MYYDTPNLSAYVIFIKKNRFLMILFIFLLGILAFFSINPNLFSSDARIWLQDSLELERTENNNLQSQHVSKIILHIKDFDTNEIKKFKDLDTRLKAIKEVTYVSSLLSQKQFYNHKDSDVSTLIKVIKTDSLSNDELKKFIKDYSLQYKSYIDFKNKTFSLYVFTKESFIAGSIITDFDIEIEQISSDDDKWEYLLFVALSALIIMILFKVVFKSFAASLSAVSIIGLTLIFSIALVQILLPQVAIHIAMSLVIVSISLLDYLYFYYRWHVSQYNSNAIRALEKSLNRNLKPAFWTTTITIVGLAPLLLIDSNVINVLCLSAIFASGIAYILNITLLPAMLSYFKVQHPKVPYGKYCYYFANKELNYKSIYLYGFISVSVIVIAFVAFSFLNEPSRYISNHNSHNVISFEVAYEDIDTKTIEQLYRLEHILKRKFETIEHIESIATTVDKLLDIKKSNLPINDESLDEALFFIQMYGLDTSLIKSASLPITIILSKDSTQKSSIVKYLHNYTKMEVYFSDVDTLVSLVKMKNSKVLLLTVATAVLIIAFFMGLIFRHNYMGIVAFLASTIPMAWFAFGMYIFHLPLTLEVLIAMTISLGLASDATIHFAYKYWRARFYGRSKKHSLEIVFFYASVPVIIGSIVLAVTFFGLSFSSAQTLQLIGKYSAILILMSLAVDLFILPILLLITDQYLNKDQEKTR
ncbi:hypothetical protein JHD50_03885 [Sulfurimonas sp. MAG313]|nr:hypothetical protein [Sulfurimonas sp. MAG313]MDF1880451.1 hypothetical protein [Sulfurimonas sp. MAG313]